MIYCWVFYFKNEIGVLFLFLETPSFFSVPTDPYLGFWGLAFAKFGILHYQASLGLDGPPIRWLNVKLKLNSAGMVGIDTQALGACKLCATGTYPKHIKFQFNAFSVRISCFKLHTS